MEVPPKPQGSATHRWALHLFSGPTDRPDGIKECLRPRGWLCDDWDIVNARILQEDVAAHDLASDAVWEFIKEETDKRVYSFIWAGPPCETWSKARTGPPGPRPLRSADNIYGLKYPAISPEEEETVKTGTYFALQTINLLSKAHQMGTPWALEQPAPEKNPVSMFNLPEMVALAALPGVKHVEFDQCMMGSESTKPTRILYFNCDLSTWHRKCNHSHQMWDYKDWYGNLKRVRAPHMPIVGRKDASGAFATKASAAYPAEMNELAALAISCSGKRRRIDTTSK